MLIVSQGLTGKMMHEGINMKLFEETKWDKWRNSLSPATRAYLDSQPIWHDKDLYKSMVFGLALGIIIGLCF